MAVNEGLIRAGDAGEIARHEQDAFMPMMSIEAAINRYNAVVEFTSRVMKDGKDFGRIPGTDKPTLLKPGAEKLCTLFGLTPRFTIVECIEDWEGKRSSAGESQFYYLYRCSLYRGERLIAEGDGSCNSF